MKNLSKITQILLGVLLLISVVIVVLFFAGGKVEGTVYDTPINTGMLINWAIFLFFATAAVTIIGEIISIAVNPKGAVKSLISLAVIVLLGVITYSMGDSTPLVLEGYNGSDNVESMLKMADMFMYSTYALFVAVIISIVAVEVKKLLS